MAVEALPAAAMLGSGSSAERRKEALNSAASFAYKVWIEPWKELKEEVQEKVETIKERVEDALPANAPTVKEVLVEPWQEVAAAVVSKATKPAAAEAPTSRREGRAAPPVVTRAPPEPRPTKREPAAAARLDAIFASLDDSRKEDDEEDLVAGLGRSPPQRRLMSEAAKTLSRERQSLLRAVTGVEKAPETELSAALDVEPTVASLLAPGPPAHKVEPGIGDALARLFKKNGWQRQAIFAVGTLLLLALPLYAYGHTQGWGEDSTLLARNFHAAEDPQAPALVPAAPPADELPPPAQARPESKPPAAQGPRRGGHGKHALKGPPPAVAQVAGDGAKANAGTSPAGAAPAAVTPPEAEGPPPPR